MQVVGGIEASRRPIRPPAAAQLLPGYRECVAAELPNGFAAGWRYQAALIEMPGYLRWLEQRLWDAGGEIRNGRLETLDEGFADAEIVINCSGIGALSLVPDGSMQPVRGQLVVVRNPGINSFFVEHTPGLDVGESTCLVPQGDLLLLGGSAEKGERDRAPDHGVAAGIMRRCTEAFPQLTEAEVVDHRAGIWPQRPTIRLEHQSLGRRHVIHNYGHGGSGVSLSWGCADEVTAIVCGLLGIRGVAAPN